MKRKDSTKRIKIFSEYQLKGLEAAKSMLENVVKGKTTYQKEWSKVEKNPEAGIKRREQDPEYSAFERVFTLYTFGGFFDEIDDQVKLVDNTIQRLYLKKPYDPQLWREIL